MKSKGEIIMLASLYVGGQSYQDQIIVNCKGLKFETLSSKGNRIIYEYLEINNLNFLCFYVM